ncbi:cytochrome reductase, putative [Theileria annulata]|uniref:NADPH--hemoprotein reductase n=1 Tax=Theileria annulata TaxID=5874 RepID=Q4UCX4_THEAN|nr:cytochrome reductase, putative [Theileria annulata]CAI75327.1 cytochrome reductase, putative [Theileria annulata]|eukprot:XP_954803.1 cytochrome reductase, putative [Theileria annulata]
MIEDLSVIINLGLGISCIITQLYILKYKNKITKKLDFDKKCKIFYASQTGTSERFSRILYDKLLQFNICSNKPIDLEDFKEEEFYIEDSIFIFLISTHYDGLFPDNTKNFLKILKKLEINNTNLKINYCIFGLGNSDYEYFNQAAKLLQSSLNSLNANEFIPIYLSDELNGINKEFDNWFKILIKSFNKIYNKNFIITNQEPNYYKSWRHLCELEMRYENIIMKNNFVPIPKDIICKQQYQCIEAKIIQNYNLIPNSDQSVHEIIWIKLLHLFQDMVILIKKLLFHHHFLYQILLRYPVTVLAHTATRILPERGSLLLFSSLSLSYGAWFYGTSTSTTTVKLYCDLTSLPNDEIILNFCTFIKDKKEIERIEQIINSKLMKLIREEVKLLFNEFLILFFPNVKFNLSGFLQLIPKQIPKAYTISSIPNKNIKIIVKKVEYNLHSLKTFYKINMNKNIFNEVTKTELYKRRIYKGNCSNYLCNLIVGDTIKFFIRSSIFSNINFNNNFLLIANGTGTPLRCLQQQLQSPIYTITSSLVIYLVIYKENLFLLTRSILNIYFQNPIFWNYFFNFLVIWVNFGLISILGISGIRPIYKLIEEKKLNNKVIIYLGFRSKNHILYHEELNHLQNLNNFHISYAFSREQVNSSK